MQRLGLHSFPLELRLTLHLAAPQGHSSLCGTSLQDAANERDAPGMDSSNEMMGV